MSIKGEGKKLYVGKKDSTIINFFGGKTKIVYSDLSKIEYCLFNFGIGGGYLNFNDKTGKTTRFDFNKRANDKIKKTIELIQENNPEIEIIEHRTQDFKFYQCDWFMILMLFCCCFPIGLFLMWYYKKNSKAVRIGITTFFVIMWGLNIYIWHTNNVNTMNNLSDLNNTYNSALESIYVNNENAVESIIDEAYKDANKKIAEITTSTTDEKEIFEVGDVYDSDTIKVMFLDTGDFQSGNEFIQPESGNKFIYAEFSIENTGESDYSAGSVAFDCYADNTDCKYAITGIEGEMTSITTLSPGRNTKGKICYEVPQSSEEIEIEFETDFLTEHKIYFKVK